LTPRWNSVHRSVGARGQTPGLTRRSPLKGLEKLCQAGCWIESACMEAPQPLQWAFQNISPVALAPGADLAARTVAPLVSDTYGAGSRFIVPGLRIRRGNHRITRLRSHATVPRHTKAAALAAALQIGL